MNISSVGRWLFLLFILPSLAIAESAGAPIRIKIEPRCRDWFYGPPWFDAHGKPIGHQEKRPDYVLWDPADAHPLAYKDPRTSITFYVESDGRHLSAIDKNGKLLWVKNPFEDSAGCPYRTARPVIRSIETTELTDKAIAEAARLPQLHIDPHDKYLWVRFDSSQMGYLNERTGYFSFMGQN